NSGNDSKIEVKSLGDAVEEGYLVKIEPSIRDSLCRQRPPKNSPVDSKAEEGEAPTPSVPKIIIVRNTAADAPNISLNTHSHFGRGELRMVAAIGTMLQLGVVLYSGFATHYPTLILLKNGLPVADYAFPCTAVGTLLLVAGMLLCSHVVESSTDEKRYRGGQMKKARIVWLQKTQTVSDQSFDSFALYPEDERTIITTSQRADKRSQATILAFKTVAGTMVGLCGFVVQFIGLRGMHWSASIAQLGAVLVMTVLRSWVRRGLAERPVCQPLLSGFELDWFAMTLGDAENAPWQQPSADQTEKGPWKEDWIIMTGRSPETHERLRQTSEDGDPEPSEKAHRVMMIRRDLGQLVDWRGPASAEAASLARAIEVTMDALFGSSHTGNFTWSPVANYAQKDAQSIHFRLERQKNGNWKAFENEIEAALSLWIYSISGKEDKHQQEWKGPVAPGTPAKRSLRLLGSDPQGLHRDLRWWMPNGATRVIKVEAAPNDDGRIEVERHRIVGSGNSMTDLSSGYRHVADGEGANTLLAIESYAPLELLYAQDMLSAFIWAAAKTLTDPIEGGAGIRTDDTSSVNSWHWKEAGDAYVWLFQTATTFPEESLIFTKATAILMEYLREVIFTIELREAQQYEERDIEGLKELKSNLEKELRTVGQEILSSLMRLYKEQGRDWKCVLVEEAQSGSVEDTSYPRTFKFTGLHQVAGSSDRWELSLEKEGNVNPKDIHDWTPLHYAAAKGHTYTARKLLEHRADVNARDLLESTPLHYACRHGETSIVQKLLREGAEINARSRDRVAPLHCAAMSGHQDVVSSLIEAGAVNDVLDASGNTPLLWAAYKGHKDVVDYLWPDANKRLRDQNGRTPLHLAAIAKTVDVIQLLLDTHKVDQNPRDRLGRTPLHLAVVDGQEEVIRLLVELGANKEAHDNDGWTPLYWAASSEDEAIVRLLVKLGANKEAKANDGWTPLHWAASSEDEAIVRLLVELGANKEAKANDDWTPLHYAAFNEKEVIVRLLVDELGADKEAKDNDGWTPLHWAASRGNEAIVKLLVELGADKEAHDNDGWTPLHWAASSEDEAIVRLLVELGANKEAKDNDNWTPLHYTTFNEKEAIVRLLVELGANKEAKDNNGRTPLDLATAQGYDAIMQLLSLRA
ncbi:hypothetical protein QQX98_002758, partial [Neonectria punicea]